MSRKTSTFSLIFQIILTCFKPNSDNILKLNTRIFLWSRNRSLQSRRVGMGFIFLFLYYFPLPNLITVNLFSLFLFSSWGMRTKSLLKSFEGWSSRNSCHAHYYLIFSIKRCLEVSVRAQSSPQLSQWGEQIITCTTHLRISERMQFFKSVLTSSEKMKRKLKLVSNNGYKEKPGLILEQSKVEYSNYTSVDRKRTFCL